MKTTICLFLIALANVAGAAEAGSFLGHYIVRNIVEKIGTDEKTICKPQAMPDGSIKEIDFRCGQNLLAYRSAMQDQVAFFVAPKGTLTADTTLSTFILFRGALLTRNRHCSEQIVAGKIDAELFDSSLCRAFKLNNASTADFIAYGFFPNMVPKGFEDSSPLDRAVTRAIQTGALTGLPIGVASLDTVFVPHSSQEEIIIQEQIVVVFFAKRTSTRTYFLKRID